MKSSKLLKALSLVISFAMVLTLAFIVAPAPANAATTGTTYYVDSVGGKDNNNGTSPSSAWQTLSKVSGTTFQPGDEILFKAGDTWTGGLTLHGSGNDGSPIIIDEYGTSSSLPLLQGAGTVFATISITDEQYWEINSLEITNAGDTDNPHYGITASNDLAGTLNHIYINNVIVHNVDSLPPTSNAGGPGDGILVSCGTDGGKWNDVQVTHCVIYDVASTGVELYNCSVYSDTRTPLSDPSYFSAYANTKMLISNCTAYNCGDSGLWIWGAIAPVIEYSTTYNCNSSTVNPDHGHVGILLMAAENGIIQYNNSYGHQYQGVDGECYDLDEFCMNCIVQYNYAHDNYHCGIILYGNWNNTGSIIRYNIIQNCYGGSFATWGPYIYNANWYNNTCFDSDWNSYYPQIRNWTPVTGSQTFENNIFYGGTLYSASDYATSDTVFDNNCYYNVIGQPLSDPSSISDPAAVFADPQFVNLNSAETDANVSAFELQSTSQCINTGANIPNSGGQDYWGNPVPSGGGVNIGAYESQGSSGSTTNQINLALNKTATASTDCGSTYNAAKAVDGDASTFWCASDGSFPQSLTIDLGSSQAIGGIRQTFLDTATFYYKIEGSNDGTTFTPLVDRTTSGVAGPVVTENVSGTYRYIKMTVTGSSIGAWATSNEFEVYAVNTSAPPSNTGGGAGVNNLLANSNFSSGDFSGWYCSNTTIVNSGAYSGGNCVSVAANSGSDGYIYQVINNLQPNTQYSIQAYCKVTNGNPNAWLYVKDYGGNEVDSATFSGGSYGLCSLKFTTGANDTSATIGVYNWQGGGNSGTADCGDFVLSAVN